MFVSFNGSLIEDKNFKIGKENRSFKYGDGFFETILCLNGEIKLIDFHFDRLLAACKVFQYKVPKTFNLKFLKNEIVQLLEINKLSLARIRLMLYRQGAGLYQPKTNAFDYLIECIKISKSKYSFNEKGLEIGLFDEIPKCASSISRFKTNNCLPYVLAAVYKKQNQYDECILLNQFGRVADSISSNVFIVNNEIIKTPPIEEGGVEGVMQRNVIALLKESNFKIKFQKLKVKDLEDADEIFLTNAIRGVQWVEHFNENKYNNSTSKAIVDLLNI